MPSPTLDELLKSTPKLSKTDLEYVQEWMSKQPHLPKLDDVELVGVLNRCDYSLERTKDHLDKYLTMRTHAPEIFKYRDPRLPVNKDQLKFFHVAQVGQDKRGLTVLCIGWNPVDVGPLDTEIAAYIAFALIECAVRDDPAGKGFIFVLDASLLSAAHLAKASFSLIKKVITFLQDAALVKIVEVHVIRLNPMVDKLMMIVKPLLSKETQEKLFFHSKDLNEFEKVVPKSMLPENYGGTQPHTDVLYKEVQDRFLASADWLQTLDKRVVDESRRPGRAKNEGDVFGVDGSFKKLDFD